MQKKGKDASFFVRMAARSKPCKRANPDPSQERWCPRHRPPTRPGPTHRTISSGCLEGLAVRFVLTRLRHYTPRPHKVAHRDSDRFIFFAAGGQRSYSPSSSPSSPASSAVAAFFLLRAPALAAPARFFFFLPYSSSEFRMSESESESRSK